MDEHPSFEFECPQYTSFNKSYECSGWSEYFDVDHETGRRVSRFLESSLLSLDDYDFESYSDYCKSERKRNKTRSEPKKKKRSQSYDLRSTPSRMSRLFSLDVTDTEFTRMSNLMTSPHLLRSKENNTPASGKRKRIKSPFPQRNKIVVTPEMVAGAKAVKKTTPNTLVMNEDDGENADPNTINISVRSKRQVRFVLDVEDETSPVGHSFVRPQVTPYRSHILTPQAVIKTSLGSSIKRFRSPSQSSSNDAACQSIEELNEETRMMFAEQPIAEECAVEDNRNNDADDSISDCSEQFEDNLAESKSDLSRQPARITIVKPFRFETDRRLKAPNIGPVQKNVDFVHALRQNSPKNLSHRITKTKPFNLSKSVKRKRETEAVDNKPLAEQVQRFLNKTPDRFRSKAAGTTFEPKQMSVPKLVQPHSPRLVAGARRRRVHIQSQKELDDKEIEEIKKYKFHAQPISHGVFRPESLAKPEVKESTKPVGIVLQTEKRAAAHKTVDENVPYVFKAQEVPKNIFKGTLGLKEKKVIPITEPKSPAFALKKRSTERKNYTVHHAQEPQVQIPDKVHPAPRVKTPFTVKLEKKCTTPIPFSFHAHDKERFASKDKRILDQIEKEKKVVEFHAQPMPPTPLPTMSRCVSKVSATEPVPFNLRTSKKDALIMKQIEEQDKQMKQVRKFTAQPCEVVRKKPFVPLQPKRRIITPKVKQFGTEERAAKRTKLREWQMTVEAEKQYVMKQRQEEEDSRSKQELKETRKRLVHKAQPIKCFKPVSVKPSSKPLTEPKSPTFATTARINHSQN